MVGVRSSASTSVLKRKDFDPVTKHKFAFTIFAKDKLVGEREKREREREEKEKERENFRVLFYIVVEY